MTTDHHTMRLARFLAAAGQGARRACEHLIRDGRVSVNGRVVDMLATVVDPDSDVVRCDGRRVTALAACTIVLNKPAGYTCSRQDAHAARLVHDLLPRRLANVFTVGRLDRDSEGLLLLTNDGDFAERVAHPRYRVPKRYRVWCAGTPDEASLQRIRRGIRDRGELLRAERVRVRSRRGGRCQLEFVLTGGKKREIRRLCSRTGLRVERLRRVAIGRFRLGSLAPGEWRLLSEAERGRVLAPYDGATGSGS